MSELRPSTYNQAIEDEADPIDLDRVKEVVAEGSGFWRTCSGCYETEDGYDVGHYPFSKAFRSKLGSGCRECGGIGAIWDTNDYADMAASMREDDSKNALIASLVEALTKSSKALDDGVEFLRRRFPDATIESDQEMAAVFSDMFVAAHNTRAAIARATEVTAHVE